MKFNTKKLNGLILLSAILSLALATGSYPCSEVSLIQDYTVATSAASNNNIPLA